MRHPTAHTVLALFGTFCIAAGVACSDATAPLASRLRGTYTLTTVLDSFTYSDYCSLPTSSTMPPICHDTTVANTGKRVGGTVTFGDTLQGTPQNFVVAITGAALGLTDCGSCSPGVREFYASTATVGRNNPGFTARLFGGATVELKGAIATPFITGRITYYTYIGCCSQTYYTGTFIMQRQD